MWHTIWKVGDKVTKIEQTVGVKQGDNLGLILFITVINAVAQMLDTKWCLDRPPHYVGMVRKATAIPNGTPIQQKGVNKSFYVDDWTSYYSDVKAGRWLKRIYESSKPPIVNKKANPFLRKKQGKWNNTRLTFLLYWHDKNMIIKRTVKNKEMHHFLSFFLFFWILFFLSVFMFSVSPLW